MRKLKYLIPVLSSVLPLSISCALDINKIFSLYSPLTNTAYSQLLNDYSYDRGYFNNVTVTCDVDSNKVNIISPNIKDSRNELVWEYRLFLSPYRLKYIKEGDPIVDNENIVILRRKVKSSDYVDFEISGVDVREDQLYYGFIIPIDMYDDVGTPSKEVCLSLEKNICGIGDECDNILAQVGYGKEAGYSKELSDAYVFAYRNRITTISPMSKANILGNLTRIEMAKMLSQYAINILKKEPDTSKVPSFIDVSKKLDSDYNYGATLAYQLGIMGIGTNKFRPYDIVTRAEFGTALSRLLFKTPDGNNKYYDTHLEKLKKEGIINSTNPNLIEKRGYVMLMLMRSYQ